MLETLRKAKSDLLYAASVVVMTATVTLAHDGPHQSVGQSWRYWGKDPIAVAVLAASAVVYLLGLYRLWSEASIGHGVRKWEAVVFALGWLSLFAALVSPIHPLGELLFSVHMTQHGILMLVSAPLIALARPWIPVLWAFPKNWRTAIGDLSKRKPVRQIWRTVSNPLVAWAIHFAVLWVWHIPILFQAVLGNTLSHFLQHFSFFASALLFWWALMYGTKGLAGYGAAVLYVFSTAAHSGLLGALITFASAVIYPAYTETTPAFGISPIEDQQLAGLIMWVPPGVLYTVAGLALLVGWLREAEKRVARREAFRPFRGGSAGGGEYAKT